MSMGPHTWIQFDYKDGWVGLRVEPEDQERADAIKDLIPSEERMYLKDKRKWVFKPQWCAGIVQLLEIYCPNFPVILEEKNEDLLRTLLVGPAVVNPTVRPPAKQPIGVRVGTMRDMRG